MPKLSFSPVRLLCALAALWILGAEQGRAWDGGRCVCAGGAAFEVGMMSYGQHGDRQRIVNVEKDRAEQCKTLWIEATELFPKGSPNRFHIERTAREVEELSPCSHLPKFVKPEKSYQFVLGSDSTSILEMRPISKPGPGRQLERSNGNIWDAITPDGVTGPSGAASPDPSWEYNRTTWVLAGKKIRAYHIAIAGGVVLRQNARTVRAGQLGQIYVARDGAAVVRFYWGSLIEGFAGAKDGLAHWYNQIGGPYEDSEDEFFTQVKADILEVALSDIVELNDFFDHANIDRTDTRGLSKQAITRLQK
jgi:hypothetical protein